MNDEQLRKLAEKRVQVKQGFYYHLIAFITVNLFLVIIRLLNDLTDWTLIFPALPWSIGLIFHGFYAFFDNDPLSFEKKVQKEMERYKQQK